MIKSIKDRRTEEKSEDVGNQKLEKNTTKKFQEHLLIFPQLKKNTIETLKKK